MLAINTSQAATDQSRIYFWREAKVCAVGKYTPSVRPQTRATIVDDDMERLLDCLAKKESSNGKNLYGDYRNGVPTSFGAYQWRVHLHPQVSYDCAMDYDCARQKTREAIEQGFGWWWTSYKDCI
jgi:hypothetical protein